MLSPTIHLVLAGVMVVAGASAAWLMLEMFGERTPVAARPRRTRLHRWLGRTFVASYLVLLVSMLAKVEDASSLGPLASVHAALGVFLLPVLTLKVLVARRWPPLQRFLPLIGGALLALAFTTAALGVLLGHRASTPSSDVAGALRTAGTHPGRPLLTTYCVQCHGVERPVNKALRERPTEGQWLQTVGTMRSRAERQGVSLWTPAEAREIASFLLKLGQGAQGLPGAGSSAPPAGDDHGRGRGRGGRGN